MKLYIIRHGDPDYTIDSLTRKGKKEAKILSERVQKINPDYVYVSPLGRAKKTASYSLKKLGMKGETLPWLKEFSCNFEDKKKTCWDLLPSIYANDDAYYSLDTVFDSPYYKDSTLKEEYNKVSKGLFELLASHGYERDGRIFRVNNSSHDKIALFCHFGVESVILSNLLNISPVILWQNTAALTTSVTCLATEEREKGIAAFRMLYFGDLSHLYASGEEPSFAARFCECFDDDTRH